MTVLRITAPNASAYTLQGTNTYLVGREPTWVIDPGPDIGTHIDAIAAAVAERGGAAAIAVTHAHPDHVEGIERLRGQLGDVPVAAHRDGYPADIALADGQMLGPLQTMYLPGHSGDHVVFLFGRECFTGDAVLGAGSVLICGQLEGYLDGLSRLRDLSLKTLYPGHGPPVTDPSTRIGLYIEHRIERERQIAAAIESGIEAEDELIGAVWGKVPDELIPAVRWTLQAHREKLGR